MGVRRFLSDRRGNVAALTAILMLPMTFVAGMGVDYTMATRRQDQINGIADAAALAAVTPAMMGQSSTVAQAQAKSMFMSQLANVSGVTYVASNITVTATDTTSNGAVNRAVVVKYVAASTNIFATVLGESNLAIGGVSKAASALAPNTDFYLLLDTSPSMEIAATSAGITTMVNNTSAQGGCAFGCHETNPTSGDVAGNPGGEDNYALARSLGVPLRIDLVNQATQNTLSVAQTMAAANNTTYRAALYTIDYNFSTLNALTGNLPAAQTAAANIQAVQVYDNNCLTASNCNNDTDSYLDLGLQSINGVMPTPGNGTNDAGDTPQEVLFIVSDGLDDEYSGSTRIYPPINTNADWCDTIKNRGIRIAFLYLTYNPLPTNPWYVTYVSPVQPDIAPAAQACASPGLFFQVNTDGDISAAMTTLFQKAISTAHLTQ